MSSRAEPQAQSRDLLILQSFIWADLSTTLEMTMGRIFRHGSRAGCLNYARHDNEADLSTTLGMTMGRIFRHGSRAWCLDCAQHDNEERMLDMTMVVCVGGENDKEEGGCVCSRPLGSIIYGNSGYSIE